MAGTASGSHGRRTVLRALSLAVAVAAADLVTKKIVTDWLWEPAVERQWWVIGDHLGFEYGRNSGAAFGLFRGNPELLAVISIFVASGFCWLVFAEVRSRAAAILCSGLIVGGALGNLVERIRLGYVTDFVAVGPWPRFNLADSAISIGVVIFVIAVVFQPERRDGDHDNLQA